MRVDVEEILGMQARRAQINNTPLDQIEFYRDGVKIDIDPMSLHEFALTGLSNIDFVRHDLLQLLASQTTEAKS